MKLKKITFTGPDEQTDVDELFALSEQYPIIEWGILWYPKKMGSPRYPSKEWISKFLNNKPDSVKTSLHICGNDAFNFARDVENKEGMWDYIRQFNRVQLNFPSKLDLDMVFKLLCMEEKYYNLRYAARRYNNCDPEYRFVIIQANENNKIINACLEDCYEFQFLYDSSRGKGKEIEKIPSPVPHKFNGYAGGFSPDNIISILTKIDAAIPQESAIWVDMETGVRTDNQFDLEKVRSILEVVNNGNLGADDK